jgi:hypothetical protein
MNPFFLNVQVLATTHIYKRQIVSQRIILKPTSMFFLIYLAKRINYFAFSNDLIHTAILRASSFGTCGIGGIGVE